MSEGPRLAFLRAALATKAAERQHGRMLQEEVARAVREWAGRSTSDDPDDVLAVFISELRARDLRVSPRPFLDVRLDIVLGSDRIDPDLVAEQTAEVAEDFLDGLLRLSDGVGHGGEVNEVSVGSAPSPRLSSKRKRGTKGKSGSHRHQGPVSRLLTDNDRTTEVLLDAGAATAVAEYEEPDLPEELKGIPVVGSTAGFTHRVELGIEIISKLFVRRMKEGEVEVQLCGRCIGRLDDDAAAEFLPVLSEMSGGRRKSTSGIRHTDRQGVLHLWTHLPSPPTPQ